MPKVDTQGWKAFRLGDLFDVVPTKGKNTYGLEDGCDLAYIAASRENNGVNRMIAKDNMADFISAGNCLVFIHIGDAAAGFCHYVRDDFVGMAGKTSCGYLKNHVMTETLGLFLAGVIRNVNEGLYSFGESWTGNRLMDTMLPLPATPDGQPDWAYMDAYMSEVLKKEEFFAEHLASLTAEAVADGHKLDTSGWKTFRIGDLFAKLSLGFKAGRKFDKVLDVDTEPSDEFDLPLVNAKDGDNGVMYWGRSSDWDSAEMTLDIVQNGAVATGNVYAQPQRTGVLFDAYLVKPKMQVSENVLQYLAVVTERCVKQHFSYFNKCTWDRVSELSIYLPVTSAGEPDWAFMEQYMQQQMDKAAKLVDHLDAVWNS